MLTGEVWHLDVGSSHPGAVVGPKGWAVVRPLKREESWVRAMSWNSSITCSVVGVGNLRGAVLSTRGTGMDAPLVYQLFCQGLFWVAMCGRG